MNTTPDRAARFEILGWHLEPGSPALHADFQCSQFGRFRETVRFTCDPDVLHAYLGADGHGVADLLTIALGVSYYKAAAAREIRFPPLGPAGRGMAEALYTEGLAEFFVRADLPYPAQVNFLGDVTSPRPKAAVAARPDGPALVAFGGGKDSYVARDLLVQAGEEVTLASVVLSDAVRSALTATAPAPVTFLQRRLDPCLAAASREGFNGHVPITAINMLMLMVQAAVAGQRQVIFANERSADEPTIQIGMVAANHQYSKSGAFERLVRAAIAEIDEGAPTLYSILRPFSELWIGRHFAGLKSPFGAFTSCNRNFRLAGDAEKRWCGECPKCAFTSLILAPFLTRREAETIFGTSFLDRSALQLFYRDLCGLGEQKPWECVGTIDECRAALWQASQQADWQDSLAVRALLPPLGEAVSAADLRGAFEAALRPAALGIVPKKYVPGAEDWT